MLNPSMATEIHGPAFVQILLNSNHVELHQDHMAQVSAMQYQTTLRRTVD